MNGDLEGDFLFPITPSEYREIVELVNRRFGVHLTDKKVALVRGRLTKLLRRKGFKTFSEYLAYLKSDTTGVAMTELMDRLTTNHTYFYRESHSFEFFRTVCLPEYVPALQVGQEIRIWSAGCSSGEEPYTLAMLLTEELSPLQRANVRILATDLSLQVLEQAVQGVYPPERLQHLPADWRRAYFSATDQGFYRISPQLQQMIVFKRFNLMQRPFPFRKRFAAVFCRNVMIYFDQPVKDDLIVQFHRYLEDGGYLFIGHSESLGREQRLFRFVQPSVYQKRESG